jgi:hypothetical protein
MIPEITYQIPAGIERGEPEADAEHRQQDMHDEADDDAGEDRAPGHPVDQDGMGVFARRGVDSPSGFAKTLAGEVTHRFYLGEARPRVRGWTPLSGRVTPGRLFGSTVVQKSGSGAPAPGADLLRRSGAPPAHLSLPSGPTDHLEPDR